MTTASTGAPDKGRAGQTSRDLGWALRRALLGLVILVVVIAGSALLLYSSIDPVQEALAADIEPAQQQVTQQVPAPSGARLQ